MGFLRTHHSYSRIDNEDAEERRHLKARFLIDKVLEEAESEQRRRSSSKLKVCRLKRRIGLRLKRLRVFISRTRLCVHRQVMKQFRHLRLLRVTN
ncbi:hypothetical protein BHE74_00020438 [Ensete ventricosum]|uniref:Uncharacterized protein n=1 Tax=Ensete ventricosum TaxID=4639 RepID=A0A444CT00_ENSVE|nr:hypothetical protein GW17_00048898 [Ensete ventricosum]RWW71792.1 hypothetical protein BHE74_00020438 [Ensete ventricosum]RZR72471.1 hypothetical protein BHM03_00013824 [Ensete ventricosum]